MARNKQTSKTQLQEAISRFRKSNPTERRFSRDKLHSKICTLKVGQSFIYPANGYNTMQTAAKTLGLFERKYFRTISINKTHKQIARLL